MDIRKAHVGQMVIIRKRSPVGTRFHGAKVRICGIDRKATVYPITVRGNSAFHAAFGGELIMNATELRKMPRKANRRGGK